MCEHRVAEWYKVSTEITGLQPQAGPWISGPAKSVLILLLPRQNSAYAITDDIRTPPVVRVDGWGSLHPEQIVLRLA
jgi:hypothetical protein